MVRKLLIVGALVLLAATARLAGVPVAHADPALGIHNIQHVVVIMQENRSFDHYFGTYPGANGIPAGVCIPDALTGGCDTPYHSHADLNYGGPHAAQDAVYDIDGGRMDGLVRQEELAAKCTSQLEPGCSQGASPDAMSYHDAREVPNYWTYAANYVLQDDMFQPNASWSWPEHLFQVSGWSASCTDYSNLATCTSSLNGPPSPDVKPDPYTGPTAISLPWTDVTALLYKAKVSWNYFVFEGNEPDCENDSALACTPVHQGPTTPSIWNPLPAFKDVREDGQRENVTSLNKYFADTPAAPASCALPQVSWVDPNGTVSEHPTALVSRGQAYVTTLVNQAMASSCWASTAIFISWDDWGGFYDHVAPLAIDENGYGLRVPGLAISPYAKAGYIDHQTLSHDAYLKFIEDDFLGGERLPKQSRPDIREELLPGNLIDDFDFSEPPRPPLLLPTHPAEGPASNPPGYVPPSQPPAQPTPPTVPPQAPSAPASAPSPSGVGATALQILASVARHENTRLHHDSVSLVLGCDIACAIDAHGHLSLIVHRRHLRLLSVVKSLQAHSSKEVLLGLSRSSLAELRRAIRAHRHVYATIEVDATASHQSQRYVVSVRLTG